MNKEIMKALTFLAIVLFFGCYSSNKEELRSIYKPIELNRVRLVDSLICMHVGLLETGNTKLEGRGRYLIDKKIFDELDSLKDESLKSCLEAKGISILIEEIKLPSNKQYFQAGAWYNNGKPKIFFGSIMYSGILGAGNSWEYDLIKTDQLYLVDSSSKKVGWMN